MSIRRIREEPGACVFCNRHVLEEVLLETEHFFVLADHAPLIEGHLLIVPHDHLACYGALPAELDEEFRHIKRLVRAFLTDMYRQPVFFEHGVFRQTVFHAHLHAMPFGPVDLDLHGFITATDQPVTSLTEVRDWYSTRGPYFYLERPEAESTPWQAVLFAPDEQQYYRVLGALRNATGRLTPWLPPPVRRVQGRDAMKRVAREWRERVSHDA